ncbi:MFS transporter, partial [Nonomuraea sp. NPDC001023]
QAFGDRAFVSFAASMIASYALSYQMYLALPLEVQRAGGGQWAVTALYAVSALLGIAGQVRLTAWCGERWSRGQAITRGLALMGAAFLPMVAAAQLHLPRAATLTAALVCALLLGAGTLVAFPFEMATIADMAGEELVGTYYGLYNLASGAGILAGNLLSGALLDVAAEAGWAGLPWLSLTFAGLVSALAVARLEHRSALRPRLPATMAT